MKTIDAAEQITCASRRRPIDTSEYGLKHGTLYRLGPKTSKRARKQQQKQQSV